MQEPYWFWSVFIYIFLAHSQKSKNIGLGMVVELHTLPNAGKGQDEVAGLCTKFVLVIALIMSGKVQFDICDST